MDSFPETVCLIAVGVTTLKAGSSLPSNSISRAMFKLKTTERRKLKRLKRHLYNKRDAKIFLLTKLPTSPSGSEASMFKDGIFQSETVAMAAAAPEDRIWMFN